MKLNKKVGITFIVVIIITNLISLTIMNRLSHSSFVMYIENEDAQVINEVEKFLESMLSENETISFEELEQYCSLEGIYLRVDVDNFTKYECEKINDSHMGRGRGHMRMHNNYEEVSTQVEVGMTTLDVTVGMYVQDMQSSSVMAFNRQLNLAHLLSFVVSLIIAVVAAIIISKHISRPILILNKNLKHISKANYETYEEIDSNIYEIEQLNSSSKKIRDSLKEQDEIRGRLIANLSHDLRTPLTVIKTKLEAMSDGVIEVNKENLDVASERLDRIISIVGQLDQLTTIPGTDVNKVESNISKETKSTVKLFEAEARELGLTVESEIENDIILNVNVDYYNQILQNLIANAIKYNNPNGKVIVTLFKEKEVIHLVVKDTGIGIKQEEVPYIFERFYRCDKSRHAQNSSGIGLSIVKTLVNIIGGDVEVTSTYGKGTTFEIKFDEKNKEKL